MKMIASVLLLIVSVSANSQDISSLFKEAVNLERSQKEEQALEKYAQVLATSPDNMQALIKSSELASAIGGRKDDKKVKETLYNHAKDYANKALMIDANNADANYARAVAASRQTEIETENKKIVADVKDIKMYADKAISINPSHGKAYYILGKWNYEVVTLSWAKKTAVKVFFGGMGGDASIDRAIAYMEKCRTLEPYYVRNFYDLANIYKQEHKPAEAMAVLNQLVRLPIRTEDDAALKADGKKTLSEMQ